MVECFILINCKMKKLILFIVPLFMMLMFAQAADIPYFYFQSNSGNRLKLYCTNELWMWVDAWDKKYNGKS